MTTRKVTIRMPIELYDYANNKSQAKRTSVSKEIVDIIYTHKRVEERVNADREDHPYFCMKGTNSPTYMVKLLAPEPRLSFWRRVLRFVGGK